MIKTIYKKDIPEFLNTQEFWNGPFLSITKHRLQAHYTNPSCDDDDIVLLLAYLEDEIVGYMGVFMDYITINNTTQKIGWLSTWWVHPKTKGTGIGRSILAKMYDSLDGKIGISQFTPSAKRVYTKSGNFVDLKQNPGYKFVFRSNVGVVLPLMSKSFEKWRPFLNVADSIVNAFINRKIGLHSWWAKRKTKEISLEYVNGFDRELQDFVASKSDNHLSQKKPEFFAWLKANHWVQEAPVIARVPLEKYQFSMSAQHFNIYLIKVSKNNQTIGFIVLQRKNTLLKMLFAYYEKDHIAQISRIIRMHCYQLNIKEFVCYDPAINSEIKASKTILYKRKKLKESIISKAFGETNFDDYEFNYGDGDCSFA